MWFSATSASVQEGSTIVQILSGEDIGLVKSGSGLVFKGDSPVQVKRGYSDNSGNNFIELQFPWPYPTRTLTPCSVFPTDGDLSAATFELNRVADLLVVANETEMQLGTNNEKIATPKGVKSAIEYNLVNQDLLTKTRAGLTGTETNLTSGNTFFKKITGVDGSHLGEVIPVDTVSALFVKDISGVGVKPTSITPTGTFKIVDQLNADVVTSIAATDLSLETYISNTRLVVKINNIDGTLLTSGNYYTLVASTGGAEITWDVI